VAERICDLADLRRRLHRIPELGLRLPETQQALLSALRPLPIEWQVGSELSSIVGVLEGGLDGPTVLLRADMDALPVREQTGLEFASANGNMHACGHDLHMTALVGAARLLAERRDRLAGRVVFCFQPGEEGHDGARKMITGGLFDVTGERPVAAYGLHVFSYRPYGVFSTRGGSLMAGLDVFDIEVCGRGGHAARPQDARDPIVVGSELVLALQSYVTRRVGVADPAVVTVGSFNAGAAANVIPDSARLRVSARSLSRQVSTQLQAELPKLAESIAAAHGLSARVTRREVAGPTVNHAGEAAFAGRTVREVLGEERFAEVTFPEMVAEDFGYILDEIPGAFLFLGACPEGADPGRAAANHSSRAIFDDGVLGDAAVLLAELATGRLDGVRA
jgi:hippurate hydrolase